MRGSFRFALTLGALSCAIFIFSASKAEAVSTTTVLWSQAYAGKGDIWPLMDRPSNKTLYSLQMVTTTDVSVCAVNFDIGKTGSFTTEKIDVYLVSQSGFAYPDQGQKLLIGSVTSGQAGVYPSWNTIHLQSPLCYPIFPASVTTSRYYILFDADWNGSISTTTSFFLRTHWSGWNTSGWNHMLGWVYWPASWGDVWYNGDEVNPAYYYGSIQGSITGMTETGLTIGQFGGYVETSSTNTGEGTAFFKFCTIGLDWGWWTPLVNIAAYLLCPSPQTISGWTNTTIQASEKVPLGYFTLYKYYIDSNWDFSTTTLYATSNHIVISMSFPAGGISQVTTTYATTTYDVTDYWLNQTPQKAKNFFNMAIMDFVWAGFAVYALSRAINFL